MSRATFLRVIGAVLFLLLVGCGASPDTPSPPAKAPTTLPTSPAPTQVPATETLTPVAANESQTTVPPTTPPDLITDARDLIGTWFGFGFDGMYQRFNADGTCQTAMKLENLDTTPNVECTYHFEGTRLIMITNNVSGLPPCPDSTAIYEVQPLANGNIVFIAVEDTCAPRRRTTAQEHEPVR